MREGNFVPNKGEWWSKDGENAKKKKPSLRSSLLAAVGVASLALTSPGDKEVEKDVAPKSDLISAPGKGNLNETIIAKTSQDSIIGIVGSSEAPPRVEDLLALYPVQIVRKNDTLSFLPTTLDPTRGSFADTSAGAGYGNGVYWGDARTILTADHVLASIVEESGEKFPRTNLDIALISLPERFAAKDPAQIVHDDPELSDRDIQGAIVSIVGIDPDATSNPETGRKAYIGRAARVSPERARFLAEGDSVLEKLLAKSFMITLPPGEATKISPTNESIPAQGVSGSPVFCTLTGAPVFTSRNGKPKFCGIFWVVSWEIGEATKPPVETAFFFGIDEVRKATSKRFPYEIE